MADADKKRTAATRKKSSASGKLEKQALTKVLRKPAGTRNGAAKSASPTRRSRGNSKKTKNTVGKSWGAVLLKWLVALLLLAGVVFGGYRFWKSDAIQMRFVYMWDYQQDIVTYSEKNKIDPFLVAAIIKNESNFNHKAVSKAGAVGLMQIMPETGRWIAKQMGMKDYQDDDLYKVQNNIRMGCWYVSELDSEFHHNLTLIMMAYNAGRGQTKEWMQENKWDYNFNNPQAIPYPETRGYVTRVLHDRDMYYRLYKEKLQKQ